MRILILIVISLIHHQAHSMPNSDLIKLVDSTLSFVRNFNLVHSLRFRRSLESIENTENSETSIFGTNIKFTKLNFEPGDRIYCRTNKDDRDFHVMMAASNDSFIHLTSHSPYKSTSYVRRQTLKDFLATSNQVLCLNLGNSGSQGRNESVQRANSMVDKIVYHDYNDCNCEDYVNYWTNTEPTIASNENLASECQVKISSFNKVISAITSIFSSSK